MVTSTRAIVAAGVALLILVLRHFFPEVANELGGLEGPLVDFIVAVLAAYAGLYTATYSQIQSAQKAVE